jgi:hypothetical protein
MNKQNTKGKYNTPKKTHKTADYGKEPSSACVKYTGPIRIHSELQNASLHSVVLSLTGTLNSDSGGNITPLALSSDPTGAANWSSFALCFDEYRTLGMEVLYWPNDRYDPGLTQHQRPLATVVDHNGSAALTSYLQASGFESFQMKSVGDPWKRSLYMNEFAEARFNNTSASPANLFYLKIWATGLAVSSEYGRYIVFWRVQFRGHGI